MPTDFRTWKPETLAALAGDLTAEVQRLRAEVARLKSDLLSARQFGQTMTPNPLMERRDFQEWEG